MTAADAAAIAAWRYPGVYAFYDADADPDDLAELLDPAEWGVRYFAVDGARATPAAFLVVTRSGERTEIGLGLRPDLTGRGLGGDLVQTGLRFATARLGARCFELRVAAFNARAIRVYERAGFRETERFEQATNGGRHPFVRMARGPLDAP
jgi:ribosomal-protein-alanine N-acetyltransferase